MIGVEIRLRKMHYDERLNIFDNDVLVHKNILINRNDNTQNADNMLLM
jgi:hypothetical protein